MLSGSMRYCGHGGRDRMVLADVEKRARRASGTTGGAKSAQSF